MASPYLTGGSGAVVHYCQWPDCRSEAEYTAARGISKHHALTRRLYVCRAHLLAFRLLTDAEARELDRVAQRRRGRIVSRGIIHAGIERHGDD